VNAGDRQQVERQQKLNDARVRQQKADLRQICSTHTGRRFIWGLLCETAPLTEAYTGNAETYYRLGRQAIGRWILDLLLNEMPELYTKMVREAKAWQAEAEKEAEGN
jgi:hypothetical protein